MQSDSNRTEQYREIANSNLTHTKNHTQTHFSHQHLQHLQQFPATEPLAKIHASATRFGYRSPTPTLTERTVCGCCLTPVDSKPLGLLVSTTPSIQAGLLLESFYLDSGVSLFFTSIKFLSLLLLILFLTVSMFALSMSLINEDYCALPHNCGNSTFIRLSPAKHALPKYTGYLQITDYLNLTMIALAIVTFQFWRKYTHKLHQTLRYYNRSQDDFTVMVTNLPHIVEARTNSRWTHEEKIKQFLEEKVSECWKASRDDYNRSSLNEYVDTSIRSSRQRAGSNDVVKSVSLCYHLQDLSKIDQIRTALIQNIAQNGSNANNTEKYKQLELINQEYINTCQSFRSKRSLNWALTQFQGSALVSFQLERYRNSLLQYYSSNSSAFLMEGSHLKLDVAPMPQEIEWQNVGVSQQERRNDKLLCLLTVILVLVLSLLLQMGLQNKQVKVQGRRIGPFAHVQLTRQVSFAHNLIIVAATFVTNYILSKIITAFTSKERYFSKTQRLVSTVTRTLLAQVINTVGIYFLLALISGQSFLQDDGLVVKVCLYVALMGGSSVLLNLLRLERLWMSSLRKEKSTQVDYNKNQSLPQFDICSRYCSYLTLLYIALFFSYIAPLCIPIVTAIFLLSYWVDKYILFRCNSLSQPPGVELAWTCLRLAEWSIVAFALGNLYFSWKVQKDYKMINWLALGLAIAYKLATLLQNSFLDNCSCGQDSQTQTDSYTLCLQRGKFPYLYWLMNPASICSDEPDLNKSGEIVQDNNSFRIASEHDLSKTC